MGPYHVAVGKPAPGDVFQELVSSNPQLGLSVLERRLKAMKANRGDADKQAIEEARKAKWCLHLAGIIEQAGLPAASKIAALPDPEAAWRRAFGSRRWGTLKNRASAWSSFAKWIEQAEGKTWPEGPGSILQYLQERWEGGTLHKTTPSSLMSSLLLLEQVGQVPAAGRLSEDPLVVAAVKSWSTDLETSAVEVKQAPMFTVAIILALELTLVRAQTPSGLRFAAFMVLIMVWSALRCDDLQNIDPSSVGLSQLGLKFTIRRTKTSGPGKRQGALQGFVLRSLSLSGYDWIASGWDVLRLDDFAWARDFLCVDLSDSWEVASRGYLEPEGVAAIVRGVLRQLHAPRRQQGVWGLAKNTHLVPDSIIKFWSGHSARHVLPSLAAAIGISADKINFLGRWAVARSASATYIQTSRQIVHQVQGGVCRALLEGTPEPGYIEEELLVELQRFAVAQGSSIDVQQLHGVMSWNASVKCWSLGGKYPAIAVNPDSLRRAVADPAKPDFSPGEDLEDAPYFITISRSGFRRLHISKACAVRQERCIEWVPVHQVSATCADAICKLCRPRVDTNQEPSSASASTDDEAGPSAAAM